MHETLAEYYKRLGLNEEAWHVGPEHPALEELAIRTLSGSAQARILEVGVQSGGFAVPVIQATAQRHEFAYVGIDNLAYRNAVPLRLVAEYLAQRGVTKGIRFIEGDSSSTLQSLAPASFDLILLDHYKPKYPIDLLAICQHGLLDTRGTIILHDVLANAAQEWRWCARVCRALGYEWTIDSDVPQGAALVRRSSTAPSSPLAIALLGLQIKARWFWHTTVMGARRLAGRTLRALGLRA